MNFGLDNILIPFRNRLPDLDKPVTIYRNLHAKDASHKYSVRQGGLVVAHTCQIMLYDVKFIVNKVGQAKVRANKRKLIHAFVRGKISQKGGMGTTAADPRGLPAKITYNPYKNDYFECANFTKQPFYVTGAMVAMINNNGVSAAYTQGLRVDANLA